LANGKQEVLLVRSEGSRSISRIKTLEDGFVSFYPADSLRRASCVIPAVNVLALACGSLLQVGA
jgi:hypothetical protein